MELAKKIIICHYDHWSERSTSLKISLKFDFNQQNLWELRNKKILSKTHSKKFTFTMKRNFEIFQTTKIMDLCQLNRKILLFRITVAIVTSNKTHILLFSKMSYLFIFFVKLCEVNVYSCISKTSTSLYFQYFSFNTDIITIYAIFIRTKLRDKCIY